MLLGILNSQAAGGAVVSDFDLVETQVLSTTSTSVTFTGLDSLTDYKHLHVRVSARAGVQRDLLIRYNGNASASYTEHRITASGAAMGHFFTSGLTESEVYAAVSDDTNAGEFGSLLMDFPYFASTSRYQTHRGFGGAPRDQGVPVLTTGGWMANAAITSIEFFCATAMVAGTRFSLYGMK